MRILTPIWLGFRKKYFLLPESSDQPQHESSIRKRVQDFFGWVAGACMLFFLPAFLYGAVFLSSLSLPFGMIVTLGAMGLIAVVCSASIVAYLFISCCLAGRGNTLMDQMLSLLQFLSIGAMISLPITLLASTILIPLAFFFGSASFLFPPLLGVAFMTLALSGLACGAGAVIFLGIKTWFAYKEGTRIENSLREPPPHSETVVSPARNSQTRSEIVVSPARNSQTRSETVVSPAQTPYGNGKPGVASFFQADGPPQRNDTLPLLHDQTVQKAIR